jgi:hypothetical protein
VGGDAAQPDSGKGILRDGELRPNPKARKKVRSHARERAATGARVRRPLSAIGRAYPYLERGSRPYTNIIAMYLNIL